MSKRIRRTPEEARALILRAAQARLASTGPEGLRLQDIAADAGISHPSILHHFGSREGLVRALTQQAVEELRDRLLAALAVPDPSTEAMLAQVFGAFRGGLAQRLAWLQTMAPAQRSAESAQVMRQIADALHARRQAMVPDLPLPRADTDALVHLIATAAFGDAMFGGELRRSAGVTDPAAADEQFRAWLATLLREHLQQR